ncbi:MAG: hypothetical protein KJ569_06330 [Candidatus Omnitrophica bacterium]|nr:hypothetical protein [Candidatus Omnitrophota bacterium]MBU1810835.1 hypothetical protein [Candidatus Omnitrophota bacterium]
MKDKKITPIKAVRLKCLDCSAGQPKEIKLCSIEDCALFPYRFGKNPNRKGIGNSKGVFCKKSPTQRTIS